MLINLLGNVTTRNMSYEGDCDRGTLLRYTSDLWFIGTFIKSHVFNPLHFFLHLIKRCNCEMHCRCWNYAICIVNSLTKISICCYLPVCINCREDSKNVLKLSLIRGRNCHQQHSKRIINCLRNSLEISSLKFIHVLHKTKIYLKIVTKIMVTIGLLSSLA